MEKEENQKSENDVEKKNIDGNEELVADSNDRKSNNQITDKEEIIEKTSEEKILELEDKLARTFAEMENQRRRFEKEKDEAFEYGGFTLAKESLNLIDNLDRSKQILKNDDTLKNSKALVKILEHLDIIYKDLISIFSKNNIRPIESLEKKLDPNFHQAMMEVENDQKEPWLFLVIFHFHHCLMKIWV